MAERRRWQVEDAARPGTSITIAGLDFGGDGPLAVLHHANGMCGALWAPVARLLADRWHVFAIDARGHGDSDAPPVPQGYAWGYFVNDLAQVARQLAQEFDQPRVDYGVGSSFGGIVTAACEAEHPGTFGRVAMLDPPLHPTPESLARVGLGLQPAPPTQREQLVAQTLKRRAVWPSREAARAGWRDKPVFAPWCDEAFDLYLSEGMRDLPGGSVELKCQPAVEAHIFATTGSLDTTEFAPRITVPVVLAHAARGFFPREFFERVAALFPRGRFMSLPGGHLLPLEAPQTTAAALRDFADTAAGQS